MIIIARTTGDPLALGKTAENAIHDLNADLVVFDVTTLELRQQIASFGQRVAGTFVGAFGLLALVLAAVEFTASRPTPRDSARMKSASAWRWVRAK